MYVLRDSKSIDQFLNKKQYIDKDTIGHDAYP